MATSAARMAMAICSSLSTSSTRMSGYSSRNSRRRCVTHTVPRPIGVVMRRSPDGLVVVSVSSVSAVESLLMISLAVPNSISPCSVSTRPRAWRWNRETFSSFSRADT